MNNPRHNAVAKRDTTEVVRQQPVVQAPVVQSPSVQALAQLVANNPLLPRIHLAMSFPRDLEAFEGGLRAEVLGVPEGMVYAKPQGKEKLRGPSIRMAEIAARRFRNLWISEPKVEERDNRVTVTVEALDLESNCSQPGTATTSLVGKDRRRMRDDVVSSLVSATVSRAKRNAIIALIGRRVFDELVGEVLSAERKKAEEMTPEQKREEWRKAIPWWGKLGVSEADVLRFCRAKSPEDVSTDALVELRAAREAVREGTPARVALGLDSEDAQPVRADASDDDFFDGEDTGS